MAARRVPTTAEVIAGARVNIVLKQDQSTGRTVAGTVRDVLTRGNHPRGIKVRLADGRVGRVQTMARGSGSNENANELPGNIAQNAGSISAGDAQGILGDALGPADGAGSRPRQRGRRHDDGDQPPPQQETTLAAYMRPAKQNRRRRQESTQATEQELEEIERPATDGAVTCPVCGTFEGDEAAVTHHISSHFDQ
ncbi:hypothetical protein jhhlp_003936 [Lomentospora prolificans]|uniref:UBZ4-type domain-containing protein n=1 Tax=Lomentospora prolificans TaxID=41688 RepID=A0A2N3NAB6_9PEZI|nr:hypothetical protein jhhlp_003936 [Lomentospora prolificans]